jgi:hypothetical protein
MRVFLLPKLTVIKIKNIYKKYRKCLYTSLLQTNKQFLYANSW